MKKSTASKKDAFQQSGTSPTKPTKTQTTPQRYRGTLSIRRLKSSTSALSADGGAQ